MEKIKKGFKLVFFSALLGFILGFLTYRSYKDQIDYVFKEEDNSYAFQVGVYKSLDTASTKAQNTNGIVVPEKDYYRVYIAVATNADVKDKLSNYYNSLNIDYYIRDLNLNDEILNKLSIYETLLEGAAESSYDNIIHKMLQEYEKDGNI